MTKVYRSNTMTSKGIDIIVSFLYNSRPRDWKGIINMLIDDQTLYMAYLHENKLVIWPSHKHVLKIMYVFSKFVFF